jgi:enoyl-CoA hydratase
MPDRPVLVTHDGPTAIITLNRPEVHNALNRRVFELLSETIAKLESSATRAILLTGAGERAFSAGADLDELTGLDLEKARQVLAFGQSVMAKIAQCSVPVVAAVNGVALGGGFELVLASSFAVMSTGASLGLPEAGLGLIPGYGGTQRLPRLVGSAVATHLMLTGTRLSAQRAFDLGLSPLEPVEPAELLNRGLQVAAEIAKRGPGANAAILEALRTFAPRGEDLELETSLAASVTVGAEAAEGIAAFKQRRPANFPPRPSPEAAQ